jgi:hypothetical protein
LKSFHPFRSAVPVGGNPGSVTGGNWNDALPGGNVPTAYTVGGTVPTTVDYIRATGGAGGIALVLTSSSQIITGPTGSFTVNQVYFAKKVDAGAGAITFTDSLGALFESGEASYALTQQGQWAIFLWNGVSWDVFGGQVA